MNSQIADDDTIPEHIITLSAKEPLSPAQVRLFNAVTEMDSDHFERFYAQAKQFGLL